MVRADTTARRSSDGLTFDAEAHEYRIGGRVVPSVTQVLKGAGLIDTSWFTDAARTRGQYVARATELYDKGTLDFDALDFELKQYAMAWERFVVECWVDVIEVEYRVCDATRGYAGTLDRIAMMRFNKWIIDIKTGASAAWHPLQTAGYAACLPGHYRRATVILNNDGSFKFKEHGISGATDRATFYSALNLYNWKSEKGMLKHGHNDNRG